MIVLPEVYTINFWLFNFKQWAIFFVLANFFKKTHGFIVFGTFNRLPIVWIAV